MFPIPAYVKLYAAEWKVSVGNLLAGMFVAIAIFINHHRPALLHLELDEHKPVCSANFIKVASSSVHEPIGACCICQVLGAVGQQVFASNAVVGCGAGKVAQLAGIKLCGCVHKTVFLCVLTQCVFGPRVWATRMAVKPEQVAGFRLLFWGSDASV